MQEFMYLFSRGRRKTKYLCAVVAATLILSLSGTAFAASGKPPDATSSQTMLASLLTAITSCVFLIAVILLALRKGEISLNKSWQKFLLVAVCAAGIRLIGAAIYPGFRVDLAAFVRWSDAAYKYGLPDLYSSEVFIDYPPGYMYVM